MSLMDVPMTNHAVPRLMYRPATDGKQPVRRAGTGSPLDGGVRPLHAGAIPRALMRSPVTGVVVTSLDGTLVCANETFRKFLGYASAKDLLKRNVALDLLARSDDWKHWRNARTEGDDVEVTLVSAYQEEVTLRGHVERLRARDGIWLRGVFTDWTAMKQSQDLLLRSAGMEAVSKMSAGVCHDFNNLLTVLLANLYLVAESVRDRPDLHESLKRARTAAKRGADLSRQLMTLAHDIGSDTQVGVVDLGKVVHSLLPLLSSAVGAKVGLKTSIASDIPCVRVNRAQLESVITNLVINARDALADAPAGTVTVSVRLVRLDRPAIASRGIEPGDYVALFVRDNGIGMSEAVLNRAFEVFFTTKTKGKGNGLGLPMVRWFAERFGGVASLLSRPGQGTSVTVLLPACDATVEADKTVVTGPISALPGGEESIVLAASDATFRSSVAQILSALGYRVTCIETPLRVMAAATEHGARCLVVDAQVLSETLVQDIASQLRDRKLGVVVVGHTELDWADTHPVRVSKPFDLSELCRAVRESMKGEA